MIDSDQVPCFAHRRLWPRQVFCALPRFRGGRYDASKRRQHEMYWRQSEVTPPHTVVAVPIKRKRSKKRVEEKRRPVPDLHEVQRSLRSDLRRGHQKYRHLLILTWASWSEIRANKRRLPPCFPLFAFVPSPILPQYQSGSRTSQWRTKPDLFPDYSNRNKAMLENGILARATCFSRWVHGRSRALCLVSTASSFRFYFLPLHS